MYPKGPKMPKRSLLRTSENKDPFRDSACHVFEIYLTQIMHKVFLIQFRTILPAFEIQTSEIFRIFIDGQSKRNKFRL